MAHYLRPLLLFPLLAHFPLLGTVGRYKFQLPPLLPSFFPPSVFLYTLVNPYPFNISKMDSIKCLPRLPSDLLHDIADHLDDIDVASLSASSLNLRAKLDRAWRARVKKMLRQRPELLFDACASGAVRIVQALLQDGHVNPTWGIASTPQNFTISSRVGSWNFLNSIQFPAATAVAEPQPISEFCRHGTGSFCFVSSPGDHDGLGDFYNAHTADVNSNGHTCRTTLLFPIHLAASSGDVPCAKMLLEDGARLDSPCYGVSTYPFRTVNTQRIGLKSNFTDHVVTPLFVAINHGHTEMVKLLLQSGASSNVCLTPSQHIPLLHAAAGVIGWEMVDFCLGQGYSNLEEVNYAGLTPIWVAYLNQNWEGLRLLKSRGANIDFDLGRGFTPLAHASLTYNYGAANALIHLGADHRIKFFQAPNEFYETSERSEWGDSDFIGLNPLEIYFKIHLATCPWEKDRGWEETAYRRVIW